MGEKEEKKCRKGESREKGEEKERSEEAEGECDGGKDKAGKGERRKTLFRVSSPCPAGSTEECSDPPTLQPQQPHTHQGPRSTQLPHPDARPLPLPLPLPALPAPVTTSSEQEATTTMRAQRQLGLWQGHISGHKNTTASGRHPSAATLDPLFPTSPFIFPSVLYSREKHGLWATKMWVSVPSLPPKSCVALSKSLDLCGPLLHQV